MNECDMQHMPLNGQLLAKETPAALRSTRQRVGSVLFKCNIRTKATAGATRIHVGREHRKKPQVPPLRQPRISRRDLWRWRTSCGFL